MFTKIKGIKDKETKDRYPNEVETEDRHPNEIFRVYKGQGRHPKEVFRCVQRTRM